MRPEIRRLTAEQFLSLLASVRPSLTRKITAVHLHHTWRPTRAQFRGLASIEAMRNYHIGLGWDDIAQHLTIDPVGICWTGRNWNLPPASQKGKNGNADAGPFMIEMVGDFDQGQDALDGEQRRAVCAVVAGILDAVRPRREGHPLPSRPGLAEDLSGHGRRQGEAGRRDRRGARRLRAVPQAAALAAPRAKRPGARQAAPQRRCRFPSSSSSAATSPSRWTLRPPGTRTTRCREDRLAARTIAEESATPGAVVRRRPRPSVARAARRVARTASSRRQPHRGQAVAHGRFKMDDESIADIIDGIRDYAESTRHPAPDAARARRPGEREVGARVCARAPTLVAATTASTRSTSSGKPAPSRSSRTGSASAAGWATGGTADSSASLDRSAVRSGTT